MQIQRNNNFDLIRLLAATQVVFIHTVEHLHINLGQGWEILISVLRNFPGVSIFFTVSGFLIYWSYDRNHTNLKKFFKNRVLRIFPALWICFIITLLILFGFGTLRLTDLTRFDIIAWMITQISFMQFYTPDLLRSFGVGTPNGSLWTITVELQFYILVPIIFYLTEKFNSKWKGNIMLLFLFLLSIAFYSYLNTMNKNTLLYKFSGVIVIPYLFNFITGIIIYRNWEYLKRFIENKGLTWFILYFTLVYLLEFQLGLYVPHYWPNFFGLIGNVCLSFLTISIAYSYISLSEKLLKGFDISYGVYIYHMLIVNIFFELNLKENIYYLFSAIIISYLFAILSWSYIEKRVLSRRIQNTILKSNFSNS